ncbi:MAG: O-antigen ligase family protein [bacterium]
MAQQKITQKLDTSSTVLEKIIQWGMIVMLALMPLLYSNGRIASAVTSKQFFIIGCIDLLVIVWVWLLTTDSRYRITVKNAIWFIPATLFVSSMTVSTFIGVDFYTSFLSTIERGGGLLFILHLYLFALMIASVVRARGMVFIKSLFQAILFSAVGVAILTFFTREAFDIGVEWLNESVGGATLGNSTIAGSYFVFALFGALFLWISETKVWKKILYGIGLLIIGTSPIVFNVKGFFITKTAWAEVFHNPLVIIGQARAAVVSIIIGLIIAVLVYIVATHQKKIVKGLALAGVVVILLGIGYSGYQVLQDGSRVQQLFMDKVGQNRITFWHEAFAGIRERPWLGWGPENFKVVHQKYLDPILAGPARNAEIWVDKPHNALIETVVTQGYIGLIAYIIFISALFTCVVRLMYLRVLEPKYGAVFIGLLTAYLLQNQFAFDSIISLVCLWLLVGIVLGYTDQTDTNRKPIVPGVIIKGMAAIITVACIVVWVFAAYFPSRKMIVAKEVFDSPMNVRPEQYADLFTGHGSLQFTTNLGMMVYTLAESYLAQRAVIMQSPQLVDAASHEVDMLLDAMDSVDSYSGKDYRFKAAAAIFQETQVAITQKLDAKRVERMNRYAQEAIALSPTNPFGYMIYSKILLYTQNISEARVMIDKAIALNPTIKEAHLQKIAFEQAYGNRSQQQAAIADLARYFPESVDMYRK